MAIMITVQKKVSETAEEVISRMFGEQANAQVIYMEIPKYDHHCMTVMAFENQVISTRSINLCAFSDDYRPGVSALVPVVKDGVVI